MLTALLMPVALLVLVLGLLAIPLDLEFEIDSSGANRLRVSLGWLFGVLSLPLTRGTAPGKSGAARSVHKRTRNLRRWHDRANLLAEPDFLHDIAALLRRLWGRIQVRRLSIDLHLGLEDPADTGMLWAGIAPFVWGRGDALRNSIRLHPDFSGARFEIKGAGRVRLVPAQMVSELLIFLLRPRTWRALRASRHSR